VYLKKIELKGFKSFADRIEIDFLSGITCIVGPNGTGKSNITDAVKWVLGEQKASSLRGEKMQDVIFNGTVHRKALNFAEVILYLDNKSGFFNSEFTDISIKRRLHRSGESEYLINNNQCRLKDVKELFMDTGVGTSGYSIIGQGNIDDILSDNKFDRRLIFEEAAGIVKFNTKKTEAKRRLEKVDDNIDRINDIVIEVEDRIEPLKEESEKAKEFISIEKQVKSGEIKYLLDEYNDYKYKADSIEKKMIEKENELTKLKDKKVLLIEKIDYTTNLVKDIKEKLEKLKSSSSSLLKEKDDSNIDIKVREEKLSNKKNELSKMKENLMEIQNKYTEVSNDIDLYNKKLKNLSEDKNLLSNELITLDSKHAFLKEKKILQESGKDEINEKLVNVLGNIESNKAQKEKINEYIEKLKERNNITNQSKKLAKELVDDSNEKLKKNSLVHVDLDNKMEKNITISNIKAVEVDNVNKKIEEKKLMFEEINKTKYKAESELEVLKNIEKSSDGINSTIKRILKYFKDKKLNDQIIGMVSDLMEVPDGYEEAISVSLGRALTNIVTESDETASELIKYLKKDNVGRATFLPIGSFKEIHKKTKISGNGFLGYAAEIIKYDDKYKNMFDYLLGKVLIVDNIDNGIKLSKTLKQYFKIVTLDGDVIITNGAISGGSKNKHADNMFKRKQKIDLLDKKCVELTQKSSEIGEAIDKYKARYDEIIDTMEKLKNQLIDYKSKKSILVTEDQVLVNKLENDNKNYKLLSNDQKSIEKELGKELENLNTVNNKINELIKEKSKLESILTGDKDPINSEKSLNEVENLMTEIKIEIAKNIENTRNSQSKVEELVNINEQANQRIVYLNELIEKFEEEIFEEIELLDFKKDIFSKLLEKVKEISIKKSNYTEEILKYEENVENYSRKTQEVEDSTNNLRENIHSNEIEKTKLDVKSVNISNKIWELYEMSVIEAQNYIKDIVEFISKTQFKKLKRRLKEIEHVNLNSIKEYEVLKERYEFMLGQLEDLTTSKEELNKFIHQMERKIVKRFRETFNDINKEFKITFNKLFGGGTGELVLEDPNDILGSDINIMASPLGKKMKNINLLSGGEKALTAIALLFAVLKAKPTPFCILDEIEAALDDVNIFKFGEFLRDLSKKSQFVVITHRKRTMEFADVLYGVSMQEYGVSNIISVNLAEYDFEEEVNVKEII